MSPLQARLTFLSFWAIAGAISANALYFQEAPLASKADPVRPVIKKVPEKKVVEKPIKQIVTKSIEPQVSAESEERKKEVLPNNSIRAIQRELKNLGYEPGAHDGAAGLLTRAAILAFEYDKGLRLTGEPTDELLVKILVRPANNKKKFNRPITENGKKIIRVVQTVLADLGYSPGKVDGVNGKATRDAIKEFEKDRKIRVTGRVSGRLIKELMSITDIPLGGG